MTKEEFNAEWLKAEELCNLFDVEICGKKIWKYIRITSDMYFFDYELENVYQNGRCWANMPKGNIIDLFFNYVKNPYRDMFCKDNPLFSRSTDLLYVVNRQNTYRNGKFIHRTIGDYIISTPKDISYSVLEWIPAENDLQYYHLNKNQYFFSHEMVTALFKCNDRVSETIIIKELENKIIKPIEKTTQIRFSDKMKACMVDQVIFYIIYGDAYHNFYNYILKKIKPKLVIYSLFELPFVQILMDVCVENNIKISEIQWGMGFSMIYELGYSANFNNKFIAPTYFMGYGDFSKKMFSKEYTHCKYGIGEENSISIGKIVLNESAIAANKNKLIHKNNKYYLIISSIYPQIIDFTIELAKKIKDKNIKIIYKLHPGESNRPDPKLKILKEHNVIIKDKVSIYSIIEWSDYIIGTESTALYESAKFGKPVFIYGEFSKTHPLVKKNVAIGIESVDDFLNKLKEPQNLNINPDAINYFYADNAKKNYQKFLNEIIIGRK